MVDWSNPLHMSFVLFSRGGSWRKSWLDHGCDHQCNPLFIHRYTHKILVDFDLKVEEGRNIMTRVLSPIHSEVLIAFRRRSPADSAVPPSAPPGSHSAPPAHTSGVETACFSN